MDILTQISSINDPKVLQSYDKAMEKALEKCFTPWMLKEIHDDVVNSGIDFFRSYVKTMDDVLRKRFTGQMVDEIEQDALDNRLKN